MPPRETRDKEGQDPDGRSRPARPGTLRGEFLRDWLQGPRYTDPGHAREVTYVVMRDLYRQVGPLMITGLLTVAIITAIFWKAIPHGVLLSWALLTTLSTAWRLFLAWRFDQVQPGQDEIGRWTTAFMIGAGVNGFMWGITGWLFFVADSVLLQVVIVFLLAGMGTAAVASYSAHKPTFYVFLLPTLLPYGVRLVIEGGETYLLMAGLLLFWLAVVASMGGRLNRSVAERVSLQIQNARLVEHLSQARDEAEQASRAKTQFLANVSHELRTPLNAIIGFSEVMKNQVFGPIGDAKYERYAAYIHESGNHLLQIIGDILDVSKIESGQAEVEEGDVDLRKLFAGILTIMKDRASEAQVEVRLDAPKTLPKLRADQTKLRQIAINLLTNAVKFTPPGGKVTVALSQDRTGAVRIAVTDTGIGMKPEDVPRALTPFVQVHGPQDGGNAGTGLGLPLVKSLVELHGGTLSIDSAPGKGTTVTVTLPRSRVAAGRRRPPSGTRKGGAKKAEKAETERPKPQAAE